MNDNIFDRITSLPTKDIKKQADSMVGFQKRFANIYNNLSLILDQEQVSKWAKKYHPKGLPLLNYMKERYPLVIFEGDVGTGKTATAEGIADAMTRKLGKQGFLIKLSTRVRGQGLHGEMSNLIHDAFDRLKKEAGKKRLSFLLIDEADAIGSSRGIQQMHHEEKVGVNTLIQQIDEIRQMEGRAILFLSTNRLHFLDEAIVRRAALVVRFERPDAEERKELFLHDLNGVSFSDAQLNELVKLTEPSSDKPGFSFSDMRLRLFPEALARAYPDRAINFDVLREALDFVQPSPEII